MAEPAGTTRLTRRLGSLDGAALIVSNVIGIGIFTTPGLVASMVPGPGAFLGVWAAGAVLALIGGLVYAELGGAYPEAGGEYVYLREAFGPGVAFLSGWTSLLAGFAGAIAAGAVGFAIYLERLIPGLGNIVPLRFGGGPGLDLHPQRLVALALIALLTLVHTRGLGPGRTVQNLLAVLSVVTIAALVALGLAAQPAVAGTTATAWPPAQDGGVLLALVLVMFTYSGWNAAAYLAGEMRVPGRSLRAAVVGGTVVVTALYLGLNLLYLRTVPFGALEGSVAVADVAADAVFGGSGSAVVAVVVGLALGSGVSAMLLAGPRIYFAMARDGVLPIAFGRIDTRSGVPSFAVVAQALWAGVLVLTGAFEDLITYTAFAVVLFSAVAVAALFVLRRRPGWGYLAPVKVWGHPWTSTLFLLVSAAMLVQAVRFAPGPSLMGASLVCAGVPVYLLTRGSGARRRATEPPHSEPPLEGEEP